MQSKRVCELSLRFQCKFLKYSSRSLIYIDCSTFALCFWWVDCVKKLEICSFGLIVVGPHSSFARITSQDVLKHPNLHDRVKQATCRRFWGFHSFCFNDFDSVENLFTSFQQQTGGLLFEKNNAKEFLQIAIYFEFIPLWSFIQLFVTCRADSA